MAQIKPQKFIVEAFREQASWIGSLLNPLNFMFNDLSLAFNNQITIKENLYQEIKEIKFKNETSSFPLRFKTKFNVYPQGMLMIYSYNNTLSTSAALNSSIDWTFTNNEIIISSISGLTAGQTYTLRMLVIYG
jgi:hypothetical protein